ncbi:MAG: glycosyl hydrolase, partial [Anaerolineae bacterium]
MKATVSSKWPWILALVLFVGGTLLLVLGLGRLFGQGQFLTVALASTPTARPTATEPILPPPPTPTPLPVLLQPGKTVSATPLPATVTATPELATAGPTALGGPQPAQPSPRSPSPTSVAPSVPPATPSPGGLYSLRQRLGVGRGGGLGDQGQALARLLGFGWYVDWAVRTEAFRAAEVEYVPMIRLSDGKVTPDREGLLRAIVTLPGALWLIGNEPDVKWQDNVSPEVYAELYHDLYALLKEKDPSCQVAIGGVSQPTPLRLRY